MKDSEDLGSKLDLENKNLNDSEALGNKMELGSNSEKLGSRM